MHTMRIVVLLALLSSITVPAAFGSPSSQPQDASGLLEASARSLEGVQSMRISTVMETQSSFPGGSFSSSFTATGEFQAPDRVRVVSEQGPMGQRFETILIGRTWSRIGDGRWRPTAPAPGPLHPEILAAGIRELGGYLVNPAVSDEGVQYVVSADLDIGRAAAGDPSALSLIAGPFIGPPGTLDLEGATARLTFTIERSTLYLLAMEMTMAVPPPSGPGGFRPPGEMSMRMTVSLSDFNDPSIRIEPPIASSSPKQWPEGIFG